jgi:hypothetical protein
MEHRHSFQLADYQARLIIYEGLCGGRFPIKLLKPIDKEFFNPTYFQFKRECREVIIAMH